MEPKLIVALDFNNKEDTLSLVERLDPSHCILKVGSELFTLLGPSLVKELVSRRFKVFLDLKFHDIPNTVASACKVVADLGVWMVNVHASGGMAMMQAAVAALADYGHNKPLLIAVTVLTSFDDHELQQIGLNKPVVEQAKQLALLAKNAALDGVVCSAHEVQAIKESCGHSFITVTPGIRLASENQDDQCRIMTPKAAIQAGSDYLVIGRPITRATNPAQVVQYILKSLCE